MNFIYKPFEHDIEISIGNDSILLCIFTDSYIDILLDSIIHCPIRNKINIHINKSIHYKISLKILESDAVAFKPYETTYLLSDNLHITIRF